MTYKARFVPNEVLGGDGRWNAFRGMKAIHLRIKNLRATTNVAERLARLAYAVVRSRLQRPSIRGQEELS